MTTVASICWHGAGGPVNIAGSATTLTTARMPSPDSASHALDAALEPGEIVHWRGAPAPGLIAGEVCYAITDRRLLILDDDHRLAFGPGEVDRIEVRAQDDGTVDLCWGEHGRRQPHNDGPGLTLRLRVPSRGDAIGFLGLAAEEPAHGIVRAWLAGHHGRVAASAGAPAAWRTVREPRSGLAVDLPADWSLRTGRVNSRTLLGIYMESAPSWGDAAEAWNTLQVEPGLETMALRLNLDPGRMPASLDAVLGDFWARLFRMKVLAQHADVRLGGMAGFGVVHDLQGAGPSASLGPLRISTMKIRAQLQQTQLWLRGQSHALHVHHVTPHDAADLRAVLERVLATIRFER
jgi:hypothetical protein